MKFVPTYLFILLSALLTLPACTKDENKIYLEEGTAPVLTASSTTAMVLNIANKNNFAIRFNWTNPNYKFTTGISSHDVTYILQMDTLGANFTSPKKFEKAISNDLEVSFTVGELNTAILGMDLVENIPHNMQIRIKSTLANGSAPLFSNVISVVVTPYLDVVYPVPANLYITGAATPANWMSGGDPELITQRFTKINSSEFRIDRLTINANAGFLFVPVYGNWSNKYGFTGAGLANNVNGDDFKPDGSDFKSPAVGGDYRIVVSFKTGKYTFTKL